VAGSVQPAKKGMTPINMHSIQASLEAIERIVPLRKPVHHPARSFSQEQGRSQAAQYWSHKSGSQESPSEKYCKLCKKHGGMHITHTTKDCRKYKKNGMAKADFHAAKKAGKKPNPAK
jgi:hypothetical protein